MRIQDVIEKPADKRPAVTLTADLHRRLDLIEAHWRWPTWSVNALSRPYDWAKED